MHYCTKKFYFSYNSVFFYNILLIVKNPNIVIATTKISKYIITKVKIFIKKVLTNKNIVVIMNSDFKTTK